MLCRHITGEDESREPVMLEDPSDIADSGHKFIKVHEMAVKVKFTTFVNIGDDCIFMSQRQPDFFLIKDEIKRK